ncbi:MAG TPA: hypothetical protein VJM46_05050 [Candidatus Saccharimonadales bacterium]|nr:hypothetical protein [Candidatus Saccharimonadales bacterium]
MTKNELIETIANFGHKPVTFEPVAELNDGDELTQAINEPIYHDNNWDLHEAVDGEALAQFWDDATKDLES